MQRVAKVDLVSNLQRTLCPSPGSHQQRIETMSNPDPNERDDGAAILGVIDPVQQLNAPPGPLAELAQEIGARLTRVGQSLASLQPPGGVK